MNQDQATYVDTLVPPPELPLNELLTPEQRSEVPIPGMPIDALIVMGLAAMAPQDHPHTVSDDLGPPKLNEGAVSTPVGKDDPEADAAERARLQGLAAERNADAPIDRLHGVSRTPNTFLQGLYGKLADINVMISAAEAGDVENSISLDPMVLAWSEIKGIPLTSFDPKTHLYEMRDQVQDLITTYLNQGAYAVNDKIYNQKLQNMVSTVAIEVAIGGELAGGELQGQYTEFLEAQTGSGSGRTGFESFSSGEPGSQGSGGGRPQTGQGQGPSSGLAPEPETIRMTPEQQGPAATAETMRMTPEQQGGEQPPAIIDESIVSDESMKFDEPHDYMTVNEYRKMFPEPTSDQQAIAIEVRCRQFDKVAGNMSGAERAHMEQQLQRDVDKLRSADPQWWESIEDAETRSYLQELLARFR